MFSSSFSSRRSAKFFSENNAHQYTTKETKHQCALQAKFKKHSHTPAKCVNAKMCAILLKFLACTNIPNQRIKSFLLAAVKRNQYKLVKIILTFSEDAYKETEDNLPQCLFAAVLNGNAQICALLLKYATKVNCADFDGNSLLHLSAKQSNFKITELLLKYKVDPDSEDKDGKRPLHFAAQRKNQKLCELLVSFGSNIDAIDRNGNTPLYLLVHRNDLEELLAEKFWLKLVLCSVKLSVVRWYEKLPFWDDSHLIEKFLLWGANVNCVNKKGGTPLHMAILRRSSKLVKLLLKYGANPLCATETTSPPLQTAYSTLQPYVFQYILYNCVDFATDETSIAIASPQFDTDCVVCQLSRAIYRRYLDSLVFKHGFRVLVAGLFVPVSSINSDLQTDSIEWMNLVRGCTSESAAMEADLIADSAVSFDEFLKCTAAKSVAILRNEDLRNVLETRLWVKKYPLYAELLNWKFLKAERRRRERDELESFILDLLPPLPKICTDIIIGYLSDEDLRRTVNFLKIN